MMVNPSHHTITLVKCLKKGVEEVPSSSPSSAARTPTPIPVVFKDSTTGLPVGDELKPDEADPAKPLSLPPTDPRSAKLASEIRQKFEKLKKTDQTTPPPKSGDTTARSTPSSGFDVAD